MAARARYEWVTLGFGVLRNGVSEGIITAMHGTPGTIAVSTTVTVAGNRPAAPDFGGQASGYALVRALDNPVIVAWGANPTAADASGKRLQPDEEIAIFLKSGDLLSFLEVT